MADMAGSLNCSIGHLQSTIKECGEDTDKAVEMLRSERDRLYSLPDGRKGTLDEFRAFLDSLNEEQRNWVKAEVASWHGLKGRKRGGRPVVVKQCPTCQKSMSSREMWIHKCASPSA